MIKVVHFVIDDKFIPDSIKCFENAGRTENKYYYVRPKSHATTGFLDPSIVKEISVDSVLQELVESSAKIVILHSLYALPFKIIKDIPSSIKIVWFAWGFDMYSNPKPLGPLLQKENRYGSETSVFLQKNAESQFKQALRHFIKTIFVGGYSKRFAKDAIARIDYFAGVFPEEHEMLSSSLSYFHAKKLIHNYIHPEEFALKDLNDPIAITGNNILLGNSATYNCNHLDLLVLLSKVDISDSIIYCPLSYQGSPEYVNRVVEKGKAIFGEQFIPLLNYLPLSEYTAIMNSCSCLLLGQMLQAATCNILTAVWSGLKVFLPEKSMNYHHYLEEGLPVYSLESMNKALLNKRRTSEDIRKSRIAIERLYSYRQWKVDLSDTIELISNDTHSNS